MAQDPKLPLFICPPENHEGKFGFVVWLTGQPERLSPAEITRLISQPWCFATNATIEEIDRVKNKATVQIPPRLQQQIKGQTRTRKRVSP
jgi:hypothetical protein